MSRELLPRGVVLFGTTPLAITDAPADSKHMGATRSVGPQVIYIHATGGIYSLPWLTTTSDPPVSSHRLISKAGVIYKLVPDERIAWTEGYGVMGHRAPNTAFNCNTDGLSIECENLDLASDPYPNIQILSTALQVYEWWGRYGLLPILAHYDVDTRKKDPAYFPWALFFAYLYRRMGGAHVEVLRMAAEAEA